MAINRLNAPGRKCEQVNAGMAEVSNCNDPFLISTEGWVFTTATSFPRTFRDSWDNPGISLVRMTDYSGMSLVMVTDYPRMSCKGH